MWSVREDNRSVIKCVDCGLCGGKDTKIIEIA